MQRLHAALSAPETGLSREMWLRYGAATFVTLLALAGAQLVVRTDFILALTLVTLLGVPVSLGLRLRAMRVGTLPISRPLWNSVTVLATFAVASFYVVWTLRGFLEGWNGSMQGFWLRFGAGDSMGILIQVFLIFAAFRSFALLSDKDCTLATVPSFSVLLLLIPVHKGLEVVIYFVAWTFWAAILFALDHRSEQRALVVGVAASPQDSNRMAARSLLSILSLSLVGAVAFSAFLATRNPDDKSDAETAITSLATRLTQIALALPEVSASGGPERQIDFSSGPSLPTQTVLWQTKVSTLSDTVLKPDYLRLFSLSEYNGTSWSQNNLGQKTVKRSPLKRSQWPLPYAYSQSARFEGRAGGRSGGGFGDGRRFGSPRGLGNGGSPDPTFSSTPTFEVRRGGSGFDSRPFLRNLDPSRRLLPGFSFGSLNARSRAAFGTPFVAVRQRTAAQTNNLGFLPLVPQAQSILLRDSDQNEVRVRRDGGVDAGVVQAGQVVRSYSLVPRLKEYGFPSGFPPARAMPPGPNTPTLTRAERESTLRLPSTVPPRVRALGRAMLRDSKPGESNYKKAARLALMLSEGAVYTLRPPTIPAGRDAADYFLFEGNKRGYCTYFAGALTVLCRTQGIPARIATGFAGMEYADGEFATVREANAHAWTEIWVENWGWAIVDATPAGDRGDNAPTWVENWSDVFGAAFDNTARWFKTHLPLALLSVALSVGLVLAFIKRKRLLRLFWSRRAPEREGELLRREIAEIYLKATRPLSRSFRPRRAAETPDEWLQAASKTAPPARQAALQTLTEIYVRATFSPAPISADALQNAREAARQLK